MSDFDQFDRVLPESRGTLTSEGSEAHVKLKRNLAVALDVHHDAMTLDLPNVGVGDKRLMVEAANMTVKAALTTDRTALKARSDKTIERVLLRLLFLRKMRGFDLTDDDVKMLRSAPRAELEAALGPKLADYDKLEWNENAAD